MIRALANALLCAAAVVAADAAFRTTLLSQIRPVILAPSDQAIVSPPVEIRWEGPQRMRVLLAAAGETLRDLGVHESPAEISGEEFRRDGGYQVEVQALQFGEWIRAARVFQVHSAPAPGTVRSDHGTPAAELDLRGALAAARAARDKALGRTKFLREENAALRDESQRLARQLEGSYQTQEEDAQRTADLERRLTQLSEDNRALSDENAAMRFRLGNVIPCTVWGYYSYPQPQTIPVTRRVLLVTDPQGRIFRVQPECEISRRADPTAASVCFCVGNSWGG
jgi:hypothetical protein